MLWGEELLLKRCLPERQPICFWQIFHFLFIKAFTQALDYLEDDLARPLCEEPSCGCRAQLSALSTSWGVSANSAGGSDSRSVWHVWQPCRLAMVRTAEAAPQLTEGQTARCRKYGGLNKEQSDSTHCHAIYHLIIRIFQWGFRENTETGKNLVSERCNSLREKGILLLEIKVSENYSWNWNGDLPENYKVLVLMQTP